MNRPTFAILIFVAAFACLLLVSRSLAHAPLSPDGNESLATATLIPDPTKSWAIYAELHEGGEAQYYQFNILEGQRIHIMLFKSTNPKDIDFVPGFVLMGPRINTQGAVPDYVEVPPDANTTVAQGKQSVQATYEPFSPSTFYSLADLDLEAPSSDTYYIAVYEPSEGGRYGLAVGDRETYTLTEWVLLPFNLILVYQWEGQSLVLIFAPLIITLVIGVGLTIWARKSKSAATTLFSLFGSLAGLFFIGSGATTFLQMLISLMQTSLVPEIVITIILASIPILLGIGTLYLSLKAERKPSLRVRISLAILGVAALFAWAGLFIGPTLAIMASILPSRLASFKP